MTDHRIKNNPLSSFENKQRSFSNISYMVYLYIFYNIWGHYNRFISSYPLINGFWQYSWYLGIDRDWIECKDRQLGQRPVKNILCRHTGRLFNNACRLFNNTCRLFNNACRHNSTFIAALHFSHALLNSLHVLLNSLHVLLNSLLCSFTSISFLINTIEGGKRGMVFTALNIFTLFMVSKSVLTSFNIQVKIKPFLVSLLL
jgi:hypothetical protein